jgi:hypothetical protein
MWLTRQELLAIMSTVLTAAEFQPASLTFSALQKNSQGGKQVFVSREGTKSKIVLQTPVLSLPFGITPYQDASTGSIQSWSMDVSFRNNPEFLELMHGVDEALVAVATNRSQEWFQKQLTPEVVAEFTRKLVKEPNNPQYAPTMRIKIPCVNGQEQAKFYDENREVVPLEYVTKGCSVKVIMELSPVWFLNRTVGISWKALQVAVVGKPKSIGDYAFVDDETNADATGTSAAEEM